MRYLRIYACRNANRQHVCRGLSLYPSSYLGYPPPIMAGRRVLAVPSVYCALFLSKSIQIFFIPGQSCGIDRIVGVWEDGNPSAFETPTRTCLSNLVFRY